MVNAAGREQGTRSIAYATGSTLGGLLSGSIMWIAVAAIPRWTPPSLIIELGVVLTILAGGLLIDSGLIRVRLPQNERQVRESVIQDHPLVGAFSFGFEMGTGARTYMTGVAPYVLIALLIVGGTGTHAPIAGGLGFGLGRGLLPLDRLMNPSKARWDYRMALYRRVLPFVGLGVMSIFALAWIVSP